MTKQPVSFDADVPAATATAFWDYARATAAQAGREVLEKALWLFYASRKPDVPAKAKAVIWGALGYFVLPLDAVTDLLGPVGFTDDLAVLAAALTVVASYIDADVKAQASAKLHVWLDRPEDAA